MARKKVADLLVEVLVEAGVRRMYGVSGDSLNGITDSIRATKSLQWVHLRHEETAAFAAGAEAHPTLEQAKGFSLFMMKAVLSGRGDEILDLARVNLLR